MAKKEKKTIEHWQPLVEVFFEFCRKKFKGREPSFRGSAPRDMKEIIEELRFRAGKQGVEWTEEEAKKRWGYFLEYAFNDWWLKDNWILSNLNRQKDKVFLNLITNSNGTKASSRSFKQSNPKRPVITRVIPQGNFGEL